MIYNSDKMLPYWDPRADYSGVEFYIHEVNAKGRIRSSEIPSASLPMTGFLYLSGGEALVEINGQSYLCAPGHLLLIPDNTPFAFLFHRRPPLNQRDQQIREMSDDSGAEARDGMGPECLGDRFAEAERIEHGGMC